MRNTTHWTPRYFRDRIAEMIYQRSSPHEPWLTRYANLALSSLLKPTDVGLEFGSGRSTVWLAARLKHLTSVEHDKAWHARVGEMLKERAVSNVAYEYREAGIDENIGTAAPYAAVAADCPDNSLDFVLVDGAQRGLCALASLPKIRPGGLLVIDNVNWFLPSASTSPTSRSMADGPRPGPWRLVQAEIGDWRVLWTTNGVSDTAIFFKPCRTSAQATAEDS